MLWMSDTESIRESHISKYAFLVFIDEVYFMQNGVVFSIDL
jgi:hypothetical protein